MKQANLITFMENKGGEHEKGIDPVKEHYKTKIHFLPCTLMRASSLHGVDETGTELCPLHHIRQYMFKKK